MNDLFHSENIREIYQRLYLGLIVLTST